MTAGPTYLSVSLFSPIFDALNAAGARYVVVGGFAAVLHGFARLTADIDIIVDLAPSEAMKAITALEALGFQSRTPVDPRSFAEADQRKSWIVDKGTRVFSMFDPSNPLREVDLFIEHPMPFSELWARSEVVSVGSTGVRVASIEDLIRLKRLAGRPKDLQDVEALERILEERHA